MYTTPDYIHEPLYVITPIFNAPRFKSRWKLYERFAKHVKDSGGVLVTIELAFGERHHALDVGVTQHQTEVHQRAPVKETEFHKARSTNNHLYIKVRTDDELWFKENMINIAIQHLPEDWKYVAWVDSDILFSRPNWVGETIHQLQHYQLVQMFREAHDLTPKYGPHSRHKSFMACWEDGDPWGERHDHMYYSGGVKHGKNLWHPGFAWAARREAIDHLGGLVDFAILGSADNHMAHALFGRVDETINPALHDRYRAKLQTWEERATKHIRQNVGMVDGLILHYWHGKKADRRYRDRWKILIERQFNPDGDLKKDWQGVYQLVDHGSARSIGLRDDIRRYFRARDEDSIDV